MLSRGKLAAVIAGLSVAFLLAEIGVRLVQPIQPQQLLPLPYRAGDLRTLVSTPQYVGPDADLGWRLTSGRVGGAGGMFRTNLAGLRADREYTIDPAPGVRRLVALGDSFTQCDEIELEDCWTSGLEQAWPGTEVLNFGVPGYGPDQVWLRYQRDGRQYRPCAVLIGYMVENVNRVVNRFRPFYTPQTSLVLSKPRFILEGDGLRLLPNPAATLEQLEDPRWTESAFGPDDHWYFPGMFVANPLDVSHVVRVARTAAYNRHVRDRGIGSNPNVTSDAKALGAAYRPDREAYQITGRLLVQFARQARQDGATPVVIVFGRKAEVVGLRDGEAKAYAPLLDWLEREGVPTVDVTDRLAREALRIDVNSLFGGGGHYNEAGNAIVTATLSRLLPELVGGTCDTWR
ncbi:MAG: hypothetical protein H0V51_04170 [Chloroflexi bacterium]|nr:hypothetical protein [Chloroflexota bacterium]